MLKVMNYSYIKTHFCIKSKNLLIYQEKNTIIIPNSYILFNILKRYIQ